ncbi:MAG: hypothetical protein AAF495_27440 [Pseudomonadota bacterium]
MHAIILRANALSCLVFGALFTVLPAQVAAFLGTAPHWLVLGIGLVLLLNGAHLVWASLRHAPVMELRYFALGDFMWVVLTVVLIASGTWITTPAGIVTAGVVGLMVATFGALQWRLAAG